MTDTTIHGWYLGNLPSIESDPLSVLGTFGGAGSILSQNALSLVATEFSGWVNENTPGETLTYDAGSGPVTLELEEMCHYTAEVLTTDGVTHLVDVWVIQMVNGDAVMLHDLGADNDPFETTPIESVTFTGLIDTDFRLAPGFHTETVAPACFCPGTRIATPEGEREVETLRPGDAVWTLDHGAQPMRWAAVQRFRFDGPDHAHMPVEIKAGALGPGLPRRALALSPHHRVMIAAPENEALAPAKAFVDLPRVRQRRSTRRVAYHCLLFDRHEVILAEGAAVESFRPGPMGLTGFGRVDRLHIAALYPGIGRTEPENALGPPARPLLRRRAAARLLYRLAAQGFPTGRGGGPPPASDRLDRAAAL